MEIESESKRLKDCFNKDLFNYQVCSNPKDVEVYWFLVFLSQYILTRLTHLDGQPHTIFKHFNETSLQKKCIVYDWPLASQRWSAVRLSRSGIDLSVLVLVSPASWDLRTGLF